MEHIQPTSLQLPAKAQCEDVTLFSPNKGLDEIECNTVQISRLLGGLKGLRLVFW
ncbi:MAG: hypothetical protein QGG73_12350 [Candidatus Hydrogenedentes bacterium]|jgi:hypothetical protein|nr:hypothetical protein [Candidatus Hydrogenedentota bacterium]